MNAGGNTGLRPASSTPFKDNDYSTMSQAGTLLHGDIQNEITNSAVKAFVRFVEWTVHETT